MKLLLAREFLVSTLISLVRGCYADISPQNFLFSSPELKPPVLAGGALAREKVWSSWCSTTATVILRKREHKRKHSHQNNSGFKF